MQIITAGFGISAHRVQVNHKQTVNAVGLGKSHDDVWCVLNDVRLQLVVVAGDNGTAVKIDDEIHRRVERLDLQARLVDQLESVVFSIRNGFQPH